MLKDHIGAGSDYGDSILEVPSISTGEEADGPMPEAGIMVDLELSTGGH